MQIQYFCSLWGSEAASAWSQQCLAGGTACAESFILGVPLEPEADS